MTIRATCRLQLHRDFTFADALEILPYLDRLGISHVYASPVTAAQPGSTHGYDVIDPTIINPELGGEAGLRRLAQALRARGMGLVIDIVPNHMSVTGGANRWWNDVLARGRDSAFAEYFDIDWSRPILLPFLGEPLGEAIAHGALAIEEREGRRWIRAHGSDLYPLRDGDEAETDVARLLERQHYRLAWWRTAGDELNWRRFFTITGLAGLAQEKERVFEATHALVLRLFAEGLIDGVRVDHVDGLADPAAYCRRLRHRLEEEGKGRRPWIIVEKILAPGEALARDWGIDGTSGYDFMEEVAALLHAPEGEEPLGRHWAALSGRTADFEPEERLARRQMLAFEFEAQLRACVAAFERLAQAEGVADALTGGMIRRALQALLHGFPAYRTYGSAADAPILAAARERALADVAPGETFVLDRLLAWIAAPPDPERPLLAEAARRFHQLAAPIAAKAVEDTAFYRYGRLLSRNDVGFDPRRFSLSAEAFHAAMAARAKDWPRSMLATATHDHKRGEDVTCRLAVLSEVPALWIETARAWRAVNGGREAGVDPADEYMLYQMLVGAWPDAAGPADAAACRDYGARLWAWMEKALREAKLRSSWSEPDLGYEERCRLFVERLLDPGRSATFIGEAQAFVDRIRPAGEALSLVQLFLRCTAPGVPDCYQGAEFADLSMVDPDNRRPVDFAARAASLGAGAPGFDAAKQRLLADLLALRRTEPRLFEEGDWQPLAFDGPMADRLIAFRRTAGGFTLTGAAVLRAGLLVGAGGHVPDPDKWAGTRLEAAGLEAGAMFASRPVWWRLDRRSRP